MARKQLLFKNQKSAVMLGVGLYLAGTLVLWDAYEHRGKGRPFAFRFLPGA